MGQNFENTPPEGFPAYDPTTIDTEQQPAQKSSFYRFLVDVLETLVLSVLLFLGINAISARIRVDGSSMEPSLHSGEFVIVNRLAYRFGEPKLGDVVVFHFPGDPSQEYIKRIIGLPGDTVRIAAGIVTVNGVILNEPYIAARPRYEGTWEVPDGHIYVLGDNRNNSSDSHNFGPVPLENMIGEAFFIYWPPTEWGVISIPKPVNAAPYY
jgi:signal peptidase I